MYATVPTHHSFTPDLSAWGFSRATTLQRFALALVWLAVASGAVVFTEPAPVDLLTMGLIVGLPLVGLVVVPTALWIVAGVWAICGACALIASAFAPDLAKAATHTGVSIYLYAAFFVFAGFVAKRPKEHTKLILDAYLWAAFIGAVAGVVGYFNLLPGAFDLFTRYGRATGTFKDPNVFGPFLVPALIYALHKVLNEPLQRTLLPGVMMLFLSFAILLSFSRGAWFNAAIALTVYLYFSFALAPSNRQRVKLVLLGGFAIMAGAGVLAASTQLEGVGELLSHRAAMTQSYDVGPQGRFGGQEKAQGLILDNPLGLGAMVFATVHHHEDVHNVYLTLFLSAGWIGGLAFAALVGVTAVWGLWHATRQTATQSLFLIAYAAFLGNAIEGFVIDIDHWRHFYLEMGIVWGLMLSRQKSFADGVLPNPLDPDDRWSTDRFRRIVRRAHGRIVRRAMPVAA